MKFFSLCQYHIDKGYIKEIGVRIEAGGKTSIHMIDKFDGLIFDTEIAEYIPDLNTDEALENFNRIFSDITQESIYGNLTDEEIIKKFEEHSK